MSYGFRIINDGGNLSVDESNPTYIALNSSQVAVASWSCDFVNNHPDDPDEGDFFEDYFVATMAVVFRIPVRSLSPPLVFVKSKNAGGRCWLNQCRAVGQPGNWVGVVFSHWLWDWGSGLNTTQIMNTFVPRYLIAVAGGPVSGQSHGIRIRDAQGNIVFDAGNNQISYTRDLGPWSRISNDNPAPGFEVEEWVIDGKAASNEWVLCSPIGSGSFRRYNGENSPTWMVIPRDDQASSSYYYGRYLFTGNSGTNIFWPTMCVKETIPYGGTQLVFG